MTVSQVFQNGLTALQTAGTEDAAFDCGCLFSEAFQVSHAWRITHAEDAADENKAEKFLGFIRRRCSGEPLQYILGVWSFYGRDFFVGKGVLIPRPETEQLVEFAVKTIREKHMKTVIDLCAGSGCIGLTVALENPDCFVWVIEKYDGALGYLQKNLNALGVKNAEILKADALSDALPDIHADLLLSNPPYVPDGEMPALQNEVRFEPETALAGGKDGLRFYRAIAENWLRVLNSGGEAFFECGDGQGEAIVSLFRGKSAAQEIIYDFNNIDRFVHITV